MNKNLDQAILAASEKDFSAFKSNLNQITNDKIKDLSAKFISFLEKDTFSKSK